MRARIWGVALLSALSVSFVPTAATADLSEGITIETSAGPVTCAPDPELAPGAEAISTTQFAHGTKILIRETGALRCTTQLFGEVEVSASGLPWHLTLNEKRLIAELKGSPKPSLLLQPVGLPSLACHYQAGRVLGTFIPGSPPAVAVSVARVRLNKAQSNKLCPVLGPLNLELSL